MAETRVTLRSPVGRGYAPEIERRLFYVSSAITGFRLVEHDGEIREVVLAADEPLDAASLAAKVNDLVDSDVLTQRLAPPKVVWRSGVAPPRGDGVFPELLARGMAFTAGEGQVGLGEPLVSLMDVLDGLLTDLVARLFDAREYRYPTLVPTRVLERCGYFDSFPHFLMFVTRLHSDTDVYRSFLERYQRVGRVDDGVLEHCGNVDYCLPPTMCFHTFQQYADRTLGAGDEQVVTARGKSFRHESRYAVSLERLWDFTIREVVFLGSKEFAAAARQRLMRGAFELMERLGLAGLCEVANDPFFCKSDAPAVVLSQRLLELKYELRASVASERSVAVASFNVHDDFFGRNFAIRRDGEGWVSTACAGFGLERLAYALVCQHGIDEEGWPEVVQERLGARGAGAPPRRGR